MHGKTLALYQIKTDLPPFNAWFGSLIVTHAKPCMLHARLVAAACPCCYCSQPLAASTSAIYSPLLLLALAACLAVFSNNQILHFIAQLLNSSSTRLNCPQLYKSLIHVTFEVHHFNCHDRFNKPRAIESRKAFIIVDSSLAGVWRVRG